MKTYTKDEVIQLLSKQREACALWSINHVTMDCPLIELPEPSETQPEAQPMEEEVIKQIGRHDGYISKSTPIMDEIKMYLSPSKEMITIYIGDQWYVFHRSDIISSLHTPKIESEGGKSALDIIKKYIPNGIVNIHAIGKGNGKAQYQAEIDIIAKCMHEFASQKPVIDWEKIRIDIVDEFGKSSNAIVSAIKNQLENK
jgi:hypothetical protein